MSVLKGWLYAPAIALQFLTRIPINNIPDEAYDEWGGRRNSLVFFPLVGVVVGGIGAAVFASAHWLKLPTVAAAIAAVVATACATGCFHEDGFADTADGLGPHSREAALRAMRDSRIGSFGAVALWALLSLKVVALSNIPVSKIAIVMLSAHILSRWSPLPVSRWLPYIQETTGLGSGITQIITARELLLASLIAFGLQAPLWQHQSAVISLVVIGVTITATAFFHRRFGGVTGDCLGAVNQVVETTVFLAAARLLQS